MVFSAKAPGRVAVSDYFCVAVRNQHVALHWMCHHVGLVHRPVYTIVCEAGGIGSISGLTASDMECRAGYLFKSIPWQRDLQADWRADGFQDLVEFLESKRWVLKLILKAKLP